MKLAESIKLEVLAYWKFSRHHQFGAIECWNSDVVTVSKPLMITDTEVKTSISDMRRDALKTFKHRRYHKPMKGWWVNPPTHYFYFAVPEELAMKALSVCQELYPYAGLLVYKGISESPYSPTMECIKNAKRFKRPKATLDEIRRIAYIASNNVIKYGLY